MKDLRCVGGCLSLFVLALVFDVAGVILLFVGIFGDARRSGAFYGDFLIHSGALLLFASLAWWIMWYVGNLRVSEERPERAASVRRGVKALARKLTERLSKSAAQRKDGAGAGAGEKTASKSSTVRNVTFGKSTYFPGFKDSDSDSLKPAEPAEEKSDDHFLCYENQAYRDEEAGLPSGRQPAAPEEDAPEHGERTSADAQLTCYQNEGYEDADGKMASGEEAEEEKAGDQSQGLDTLL